MTDSLQFSQSLRQWMDVFAHRSMRDWMRFVKTSGLSMPQFSILMQLHFNHACGISDISERMDISSAAASQLVEKLVQGGLLARSEDPRDRRAKLLALTEKGHELIKAGIDERYRWVDALVGNLSPGEQEKVIESLKVLTETLQRIEPQDSPVE